MSVNSIGMNPYSNSYYLNQPMFQAKNQQVQYNSPVHTEQKQNSKKKKIAILALLTAVIGTGVYFLTRGKVKPVDIAQFKNNGGKFLKGKAIEKNGELYSGIITKTNKNGARYEMKYVDGNISEVFKDGKLFKKYVQCPNDNLTVVTTFDHKAGTACVSNIVHESKVDPRRKSQFPTIPLNRIKNQVLDGYKFNKDTFELVGKPNRERLIYGWGENRIIERTGQNANWGDWKVLFEKK